LLIHTFISLAHHDCTYIVEEHQLTVLLDSTALINRLSAEAALQGMSVLLPVENQSYVCLEHTLVEGWLLVRNVRLVMPAHLLPLVIACTHALEVRKSCN